MARELLKGNTAMAEAAIRAGVEAYFGYPITPQTELLEWMSFRMPELGRAFLQAESELAAINMVYGAACTGARVMSSSVVLATITWGQRARISWTSTGGWYFSQFIGDMPSPSFLISTARWILCLNLVWGKNITITAPRAMPPTRPCRRRVGRKLGRWSNRDLRFQHPGGNNPP